MMSKNRKNKSVSSPNPEDELKFSSNFEQLNSKMDILIGEVTKTNKRLENLEQSQRSLEHSLEFLHNQTTENVQKTKELESKVEELTLAMNSYKALENRLDAFDHADRARCLELNGIPYKKDEDLLAGLEIILKHTNLPTIDITRDVDKIYRIRQTKRVVVKFLQSKKRDEFFNAYRKNILDISKLGFKETDKIFINEVLSFSQNKLFWQTRTFKQQHGYKFVWTFRQKIYLRKTADSDAILITNEDDLKTLASI